MFIKKFVEELILQIILRMGRRYFDQEKVDVMLEKLLGPMLNWDPDGTDRDTEKVLLPFGTNPDEVDELLENMNLQEFLVI